MRVLSFDYETFSDIDLGKSGVYRYVESPAFEILLLAYAFDDDAPIVLDFTAMTEKEKDDWKETFSKWLTDPDIRVHGYNLEFEAAVTSRWFGYNIPLDTWWDTMVTALTCGLPRSLKDVGIALGMPEEEAKLREGKRLVTFFCSPCKPSKANGMRTRNTAKTDPEKWEKFTEYNRQDVVAERAIWKKIRKYEPSEEEHRAWLMSVEINRRGILVDRKMAEQAVRISEEHTERLMRWLKELTGLENPNSNSQLAAWLKIPSVAKLAVEDELKTATGDRKKVLELRQELGKTSVAKYEAMLNSMCSDDRVRGLFLFYGANRSGRFTSRIVQLQNLPQNHLEDLESARQLVIDGDADSIEMLYNDIPDTLSQLIRTTFIAKLGYTFAVADFSAIEARVVAWLAKEQWRMDLFAKGGDIYCESASAMFHVPVVKHGVNGHLRQKGKIAELACLGKDSLVLTDQGLVPIQDVTLDMKLWDGEEWVTHEGVIYKGEREVISYQGLTATPDHLVYTEEEGLCEFERARARGYTLLRTGNGRHPVRLSDNNFGQDDRGKTQICDSPMQCLRSSLLERTEQSTEQPERTLLALSACEVSEMAESPSDSSETEMRESKRSRLSQLRSKRNKVRLSEYNGSWTVSDSNVWDARQKYGNRSDRHERGLRPWESQICGSSDELCKSKTECADGVPSGVLALFKDSSHQETVKRDDPSGNYSGCGTGGIRQAEKLERHKGKVRVYDIRNAGRNHRFTVSSVLVHNCGYGGSVNAMINMGALRMGLNEEELPEIVQKWREASPRIVKLWWLLDERIKDTIETGREYALCRGMRSFRSNAMLHIVLPSGRAIRYFKPEIIDNQFGKTEVQYQAYDTGKWAKAYSYGPKFLENVTQAIARDCLVVAMTRVAQRYPNIVMHVHDEMIVEVPEDEAEEALAYMCECMAEPIPWAPDLLLRGDGYVTKFYKKD